MNDGEDDEGKVERVGCVSQPAWSGRRQNNQERQGALEPQWIRDKSEGNKTPRTETAYVPGGLITALSRVPR